nr:immunoglobulin heavy chain junction region [Mus musculus]MBK4188152.1 immunoglobulin heavy chain junction region [Mus musculus]
CARSRGLRWYFDVW